MLDVRAVIGSMLGLIIATSQAAAFPDKPITVNVCQPAGGGTDRNLQALVPFAERHLGQPIIVQYRAGAGGTLAMQEIKSAPKDGYTLAFCDTGGTLFGPIAQNIAFGPDDVIPIAQVTLVPWVFTVHASTPYKSVQDVIDAAKKAPGQVKASIADIASADHYTWLLFARASGLGPQGFRWIPYGGGAPKVRAMLAGESQLDMLLPSLIMEPMKNGIMRPLAAATPARLKEFPEVPTFRELGLDVVDGLSISAFAPAGTPQPVIDKLRAGLMKIKADPEFQTVYGRLGQNLDTFVPGDVYLATWKKTWAEAPDLLRAVMKR
jgi:tripartite-type tricarboxylate transporter receptor subunit TctC